MSEIINEIHPVPDNGGAAFFGFMGVSLALVLASTNISKQTWELPTEQQKLVQA